MNGLCLLAGVLILGKTKPSSVPPMLFATHQFLFESALTQRHELKLAIGCAGSCRGRLHRVLEGVLVGGWVCQGAPRTEQLVRLAEARLHHVVLGPHAEVHKLRTGERIRSYKIAYLLLGRFFLLLSRLHF